MLTFDEFLIEYNEQVNEAYESLDISKNAKKAIVSTMRKYLGEKKYDPVEILRFFQRVCLAAMKNGNVNNKAISHAANDGIDDFTTSEEYFTGMGRAR